MRRDQVSMAAALLDRLDQRALRGAVLAKNVPNQILNLNSLRAHATSWIRASKAVLAPQHAIDLLRFQARELLRRGPRAKQAQCRGLVRFRLAGAEPAISALDIEHGEHAGDAIARQAEFQRL